MPQINSSKKFKDDPAKRDHFGRDISYLQSCLPNLQNLHSIDLYSHDLESGYSPLHVCLQRGYLRKSFLLYKRWKDEMEFLAHKFGGHIFNQLDREGLSPLELYSMQFYQSGRKFPLYIRYRDVLAPEIEWDQDPTLVSQSVKFAFMELPKDEKEQELIKRRGGSHLLTLGSNVNYQLGTGNKDDRQNMYQLAIDQLKRSDTLDLTNSRFSYVLISRYHSILITKDNKVYTCGNSTRGRLGNGMADIPQPSFTEVMDFGEVKITEVDVSNHHSLVLTENHGVYSWGWNGYGQLGYSSSNKNTDLEKNFGPVPKRISFLEGEEVVSVACSKIHSCAATRDGKLFMWGLNVGQLGGSKPVHKSADTTYQGQDAHLTTVPIIINCSKFSVDQVVCTDFATFVRLQTNTLLVYTNYTTRSFKIPSPRAKTFKSVDAFDHFAPREVPSTVVDMKCNNTYGNNICFRYSCGRVGIISVKDESIKLWTKFSNTLPVTLYWVPNFESRKCMDFAISSKGDLLVCTIGGEVYTCKGTTSTSEKMYSSKLTSGRAIAVACDPSFVSFGIIKDETMNIPMLYPKDRLLYDFSRSSPKYGLSKSNRFFSDFNLTINDCMTSYHFRYAKGENDVVIKSIEKGNSLARFEKMHTTTLNQRGEDETNRFSIEFYDEKTNEVICKCHRFILSTRCPKMYNYLAKSAGSSCVYDSLKFTWKPSRQERSWEFMIGSTDPGYQDYPEVLREIIHFFYTDAKPTHQRAVKFLLRFLDSYHLATLPHALEESLEYHKNYSAADASTPLKVSEGDGVELFQDLDHAVDDAGKPDVTVALKDGVAYCHSVILLSRCSTFQGFLRSFLSEEHHSPQPFTLHMEKFAYATMENFNCVMRYLYGIPYHRIFEPVRKEHFSEKVQFFLDMLGLCDELNLEYLKNYTESRASAFINGGTVVPMLINAVFSNSRLLAQNCCWFICLHAGLLFSKENLELVEEHFNTDIWQLLENSLKELRSPQILNNHSSWYEKDVDWIRLFSTNLKAFNERFMDPERLFNPVFDLISEAKPSSRRKSSTHGIDKSRKHSFTKISKILPVEEPKSAWGTPQTINDTTAIDDNDEFIEVVKKSKRRTSSQARSSPVDSTSKGALSSLPGKVVIHANSESDSEKLPSLISQTETSLVSTDVVSADCDPAVLKIRKSFKKGSQKQRLQQLSIETAKPLDQERKVSWRNSSTIKNATAAGNLPTRRKKSLPSLYDGDLASTLGKNKKDKVKNSWSLRPSASNEVRSHGTWATAEPYVPTTVNLGSTTTEKKPTLEEKVAAQEFEKWFELESSKVQKQLRRENKNARDSFRVLYRADDSLPDFITNQSSTKKNNRKLKLKFQSKHKTKDADKITLS